jgi:carboxypeptidase PM20D1
MWWLIFPALFIIFLLILIIRALLFKPYPITKPEITDIELDNEGIINRLSELIKCKTVSNMDFEKVDFAEFEKLHKLIEKFYPDVFRKCEFEKVSNTGLLFRWPGKKSDAPTVLMAHYDVVPANEDQWDKPAFEGIVENNEVWGRGTLDTKGTFTSILEATNLLIKQGFVPQNDIYLSFSGDEEVSGPSCPAIVELFKKRNIVPALVIDEGGAVVEDVFPGVKARCALVGTAEKGAMDVRMTMKSQGGHASSPKPHTIIGQLSQAVVNIENNPFKFQLTPPVKKMFDNLGRHSSFVFKVIFANLWCFSPVLDLMCKKSGGELNALMRTTVAFTMASGSSAANVLPPKASFTANLRLIGTDTCQSAIEYLKKTVKNDNIEFEMIHGSDPSIYSSTDCKGWDILTDAIKQTWSDAIVSPYLMFAASDSRHFSKISDKVYRFSAMYLTKEQRALIHGNNERIPCDTVYDMVKFYVRVIKQS